MRPTVELAVSSLLCFCATVCAFGPSQRMLQLPGSGLASAGSLGSLSARSCQRRLAGTERFMPASESWVLGADARVWGSRAPAWCYCAACFEPVLRLVVLAVRFVYWTGESATFNCRCVNFHSDSDCCAWWQRGCPQHAPAAPVWGHDRMGWTAPGGWHECKVPYQHPPPPSRASSLIYWKRYMRRTRERIHVAKGLAHSSRRCAMKRRAAGTMCDMPPCRACMFLAAQGRAGARALKSNLSSHAATGSAVQYTA